MKPDEYTGWCSKWGMTHLECGGRCREPHYHHCDSSYPQDKDIHCFEVIGHTGKCSGPNGPTWEKPEHKKEENPVPKHWRAKPGKVKRPEDESTLEKFFKSTTVLGDDYEQSE